MAVETGRASPSIASSTSNGTSHKRKRPADGIKYYAVRQGRRPGVYYTWEDCLSQIKGHKGALCESQPSKPLPLRSHMLMCAVQSFPSLADAQAFASGQNVSNLPSAKNRTGEQRFYAVQIGRVPGVYTDWPSASAQIAGVKRPKHRRFDTRAEAEAFVAEGKRGSAVAAVAAAQHVDKKVKLVNGAAAPAGLILNDKQKDAQGNIYPPGTGPLPTDAEDGFDPNIKLDSSGNLVHKTESEKTTKKTIPKPSAPPGMLTIYTDGSSLRNGATGARAGVGVYFGPGDRNNVSEALTGTRQTNQRAELTAILRAIEIAPRHRDITIYTDSRYAIDCVTNWYKNWKRNGWLTANKKPVENRDLIQEVRNKMEERDGLGRGTYFVWVKGHNGEKGNVEADRLAVEGARLGRGISAEVVADERVQLAGESEVGARTEEEEAFRAMDKAMEEEEYDDDGDDGTNDVYFSTGLAPVTGS
jgi:ribonuclease HI